ncbi:sugar phosphate isomerase/epimerase [Clostridium sp. AF19-22AC]|jgi:protein FrlC|uniref:sugar phosphate isomerase/epimerase family protein n=1 Tax=Clostridia TaxID=186801 RepID=UPI000E53EA29|nr:MULTISPECIES: sugar phosphate isomerase/epimerase family protein [Clostridia]RHR20467.1 sugar phosphate isomerase/epimerase [Clostridium sp. AF19-22AC]
MNLKKSQIALSNFPYYKHSLEYTLNALEKLGGGAMELYACDPHFHVDDCGLPEVMALKKKLKSHGLYPICITPEQCMYPVNIASPNPVRRKASVDTYVRVLQYANELEVPKVQFHAGFTTLDHEPDEAWQRSADSLHYLADIAEGYGVTIVMESAPAIYTVLTSSEKSAKMIREINSPNLKGMIDTLCLPRCNEDIDTAIANLGADGVKHFHFSDGMKEEQACTHLVPGEGNLDLEHYLEAMSDIHYTGYITIEMISPYEYRPDYAMKTSREWLLERLSD